MSNTPKWQKWCEVLNALSTARETLQKRQANILRDIQEDMNTPGEDNTDQILEEKTDLNHLREVLQPLLDIIPKKEHSLDEIAEDIHQAYLEYQEAYAGEDDQSYETAEMFLNEFTGMYFEKAHIEITGITYIQAPNEEDTIRDRFHYHVKDETDFRRFDDLTPTEIKQKLDELIQLVFDEEEDTQ